MPSRVRLFHIGALCLLCGSGGASARAQEEPKPLGSVLKQVAPRLSGRNGYEELVLAGELANASPLLKAALEKPNFGTLSEKRRLLADPPIVRALALMRVGLNKPVGSPRDSDSLDEKTVLPEFGQLRVLSRLLVVAMETQFADGNVPGAIDLFQEGLRLGYVIQTDTLISGLVGVAMQTMVFRPMAHHIGQWSERDCDRLLYLTQQWLETPSPAEKMILMEYQGFQRILNNKRDNPQAMLELIASLSAGSEGASEFAPLEGYFRNAPNGLNAAIDNANARAKAYFSAALDNVRRPAWRRAELPNMTDKTPGGMLFSALSPALSSVMDRYDVNRAHLQLLGLHAAIQRYRWQHDRLPTALSELRLKDPKWMADPFTGEPLVYQSSGDSYELSSVGPYRVDPETQAKARAPVSLLRLRVRP